MKKMFLKIWKLSEIYSIKLRKSEILYDLQLFFNERNYKEKWIMIMIKPKINMKEDLNFQIILSHMEIKVKTNHINIFTNKDYNQL